jgi:hypothetical protein
MAEDSERTMYCVALGGVGGEGILTNGEVYYTYSGQKLVESTKLDMNGSFTMS